MTANTYHLIGPNDNAILALPAFKLSRDLIGKPAPQQTFVLTVTGTGALSATAQVMVSNDGDNWLNYGAPITATNGVPAAQTGNQVWEYFGAVLTAISGTNAGAKLVMSA